MSPAQHLAAPAAAPAYAPINVAIIPASEAAAAILRLAAAYGLEVEVAAVVTGEPIKLDLTATLIGGDYPVRLTQGDTRALIAALGQMRSVPMPAGDVPASDVLTPPALGTPCVDPIELHPPDRTGDPYYRPDPPEPTDQPEVDASASAPMQPRTQAVIVDELAADHARIDVCRHLLAPLAAMGWPIAGDASATLTSLADEFATYPRHLMREAARRLCAGRHRNFPDAAEIFEALGRAAKPGAAKEEIAS